MDEVTTKQLRERGYGDHEIAALVRAGQLVRVRRGIYAAGPADGRKTSELEAYRSRIRAAVLARGQHAVVSHASAAAMWGLPLRRVATRLVHLTAPALTRGRAKAGVRVATASLQAEEMTLVDGVLCTSAARTIADLARTEPGGWALAAADEALRTSLVTGDELQTAVGRLSGVRGVPQARRIVSWADARSGSVGESLSRHLFIRAGQAPDDLQHQLRHEGCFDIVDFWWAPRLAGEFDGRLKYRLDNPSGRDIEDVLWQEKQREDRLRRQGVHFARWTWDDVTHRPDDLLGRIRAGLRDVRWMNAA